MKNLALHWGDFLGNNMLKVAFYQPLLSVHQIPLLNALARQGVTIILVCFNESKTRTVSSGWDEVSLDPAIQLYTEPSKTKIIEILERGYENVVSGLCVYDESKFIMSYSKKNEIKIIIYGEGGNETFPSVILRLIKHSFNYHRYKKQIKGVLAIGNKGVNWFNRIGVENNKIKKTIYYTKMADSDYDVLKMSDKIRVVYLGRLVYGKGLFKLIDLFSELDTNRYLLDIYGTGPLQGGLIDYLRKKNPNANINFKGLISNSNLSEVFECSSCLCMLNDGDEGWGAVVNESLLHGVPVICSNKTGASSLVYDNILFGSVLEDINNGSFQGALKYCISLNKKDVKRRAENTISPDVGAMNFKMLLKNLK